MSGVAILLARTFPTALIWAPTQTSSPDFDLATRTRDGKLFMVLGSPGGPTIINTVLQTLLNVIDFKMTVQQAVDAPRIHHQWIPDRLVLETRGFAQDVIDALRARGHRIEELDSIGDCHTILVDPDSGIRLGAADPRNDGRAIGY